MTKQDRAVRTRLALIRSAAAQFEAHGYVRAALARISAGAGVSSGALHFHFADKAAVAEAVEAAAARALREAAVRGHRGDGCALQRLVDVTHHVARLLCADVVVRAGLRLNVEGAVGRVRDLRREWRECVQGLLAEAERRGELAAGVTPQRTSAVVLAATTGIEVLAREDHRWLARPSLTDLWQLLLPCLAAPRLAGVVDPAGSEPAGDQPVGGQPAGDQSADQPVGDRPVGSDPSGRGPVARDGQAEAGTAGLALR